jgi:hypothetical protein
MNGVRVGLAVAIAALALALAGCTPASPSWITVEYAAEDGSHSVTLRPEAVDCSARTVAAISVQEDPVGLFTFSIPSTGTTGQVSGGIENVSPLLFVNSENVELDLETEGVLDVAATTVRVTVTEDRDAPEEGVEVEGTLSAHLVCDPAS